MAAQTVLSNTTQIFAGVNDQQTAEYVSSRLGEQTIIVQSGGTTRTRSSSENTSASHQGVQVSTGHSENWQQQARKILKPEEVIALPQRQCITLTPSLPPLLTTLVPHFEEPWLYRRNGYRQFTSSSTLLLRAAVFLIMGLCAAGMMTEFLHDRPHFRPFQQRAGFYQMRR